MRLALEDDSDVVAPGEEQEELIVEPELEKTLLGAEHEIDFERLQAETLGEAMESIFRRMVRQ